MATHSSNVGLRDSVGMCRDGFGVGHPPQKTVGPWCRYALAACLWLLGVRVFVGILYQYRFYFPLDFQRSFFLIGHEAFFTGWYPIAFYVHLFAGPTSLVLGAALWASGRWANMASGTAGCRPLVGVLHQYAGRLLWIVVATALTPSGIVLARHSAGGALAGWGFAGLALFTLVSATLAGYYAARHNVRLHRLWASHCFLSLLSPLIFRVFSGAMIVTGWESSETYQFAAWASWLLPCAILQWRPRVLVNSTTSSLQSRKEISCS